MNSTPSYKLEKEAFVSGNPGSSIPHVLAISSAAIASIALYSSLRTRGIFAKKSEDALPDLPFKLQFPVLIVPLLLSMTLFADRPSLLAVGLIIPAIAIILTVPRRDGKSYLPRSTPSRQPSPKPPSSTPAFIRPSTTVEEKRVSKTELSIPPLPALSTYRAHMMLMTILAILAVDFPVFPRSLGKTEIFGVSLMDLGVGSFVFSQGLASARPLVSSLPQSYLNAPLLPKFMKSIRKSAPIIALGIMRVIMVKGVEYPEHETEYGTHWNFFLTLALLPPMQMLLHPLILSLPQNMAIVGIVVAVAHQIILSPRSLNLQHWVFNTPRSDLITANKEGLVSLWGYLAIHLLGLATGTIVLPPTPGWFRRRLNMPSSQVENVMDSSTAPFDPSVVPSRVPSSRYRRNGRLSADTDSSSSSGEDELEHTFSFEPSNALPARRINKTAVELLSYSGVWWILLGLTRVAGVGNMSRQLANLPYILFVVAYNTTFIGGYILLDIAFFPGPPESPFHPKSKRRVRPRRKISIYEQATAPGLLEAINKQGLVVFLLANLLTGFVNISMQTMYASDGVAMLVLMLYSLVVCGVAWWLKG